VRPDDPGISRRRIGRGFGYVGPSGRAIRSRRELERIRALAIPPAWTDVWICPDPEGHLQAVGRDARGRRQYRYHARFRARRDRGKFDRLIRFGEALPRIRRQLRRDLRRPGLPREKVVAAVISLLETTRFRVGNEEYARLNRSFGLSTLRSRHARVRGATIRFRFRGKGGRTEERALIDRRMAAIVRRCQELPGQQLFQYVDDAGEARAISSEDVNDYLRDAAGSDDLSAKDYRTWAATLIAHRRLRQAAGDGDPAKPTATIRTALAATATDMGDSVAVTRSSYVHPGIIAAFERDPEARAGPGAAPADMARPTRREELAVLRILKAHRLAASPS
jgi:DNA topoisomerase I